MWTYSKPANQSGVTLVELIIAIVIISIASVALLQALGVQTIRNVEPMLQSQSQLLASQYLEEVSSKSFFDPSADPNLDPSLTAATIISSIQNQDNTGAPARLSWDNIYEYDGYNQPIRHPADGLLDPALSGYTIQITVDISDSLTLGSLNNALGCPPKIALITVTVTDPRGQPTSLSGYRTSYWDPGC